MTPQKVYPGMVCPNMEFFVVENEEKIIQGGTILDFYQWPYGIIQILNEAIEADEPAKQALQIMHPDSEHHRVRQFARCRFGGLDMQPDIKDGKLGQGDYWNCPKRGLCIGEGKICRPLKYNDRELTAVEIKMMRLSATGMTNADMAIDLDLRPGTFNLIKKNLYDKLGIDTKQQVTVIAFELNLI